MMIGTSAYMVEKVKKLTAQQVVTHCLRSNASKTYIIKSTQPIKLQKTIERFCGEKCI